MCPNPNVTHAFQVRRRPARAREADGECLARPGGTWQSAGRCAITAIVVAEVQPDPESDARDALIGEERALIGRFDARKSSAETVTAAAVTGSRAGRSAGTAAQKVRKIDSTFAWIVAVVLAAVCVGALCEHFLAGLRPDASGLTSRSPA
jgi:hypothetical protein